MLQYRAVSCMVINTTNNITKPDSFYGFYLWTTECAQREKNTANSFKQQPLPVDNIQAVMTYGG